MVPFPTRRDLLLGKFVLVQDCAIKCLLMEIETGVKRTPSTRYSVVRGPKLSKIQAGEYIVYLLWFCLFIAFVLVLCLFTFE
jgi:hypothetical protein